MHASRLIRRHFAEGLPAGDSRWLRAHLLGCTRCRGEYDRIAALLRAAAGRQQTRAELDRLRAAVLARRREGALPALRRGSTGVLVPSLVSAALMAATAALLLFVRPHQLEPAVSWKGGSAGVPLTDLQVFAIRPQPGQSASTRLVADGGTVYLDELMQFRYLSTDPRQRYLYLVGIDETLRPMDYFPRPKGGQSIAIRPSLSMEPVEHSIRLAARHSPGRLWVYALFSPRPLQQREVHATIARLRIRGVRAGLLGRVDWGKDVVPVVRSLQVRPQGT